MRSDQQRAPTDLAIGVDLGGTRPRHHGHRGHVYARHGKGLTATADSQEAIGSALRECIAAVHSYARDHHPDALPLSGVGIAVPGMWILSFDFAATCPTLVGSNLWISPNSCSTALPTTARARCAIASAQTASTCAMTGAARCARRASLRRGCERRPFGYRDAHARDRHRRRAPIPCRPPLAALSSMGRRLTPATLATTSYAPERMRFSVSAASAAALSATHLRRAWCVTGARPVAMTS